jgi:serine/threonine-protein kinase
MYQRKLDSFIAEAISGTEDGSTPFFSPDGKWIGYFADGKLKKIALSGGAPVILAQAASDNRGATWLDDGTIVYSPGGSSGLFRISPEGGDPAILTHLDTTRNERTHRWPRSLPDGKTVIFTIGGKDSPDYYEDALIGAVNVKTGDRSLLLRGASRAEYASAGYLLYSHSGSLFAVRYNPGQPRIEASSYTVVNNLSGDQLTGAMNFAISANGTLVWIPGQSLSGNRELCLADLDGRVKALPLQPGHYMEPRISPDGTKIAFVIGTGKDYDVWIYDIANNTTNRFTFGGQNRSPVWSPDGKRIAYANNPSENTSIIIRQADGTGTAEEIRTEQRTYVNCWSRNGSTLVLTVPVPGSGWELDTMQLNGDRKLRQWQVTRTYGLQGNLSPDGRWISYVGRESGLGVVYVRPFPHGDGKWQVSVGEAHEARWSPDGKTLYYTTSQMVNAVSVEGKGSFVIGRSRIVLRDYPWTAIESNSTFDISPDGQHILITKAVEGESSPHQINVVLNWLDQIQRSGTIVQ